MQSFVTKLEQLINKYFEDTTDTQRRDDFLVELLAVVTTETGKEK